MVLPVVVVGWAVVGPADPMTWLQRGGDPHLPLSDVPPIPPTTTGPSAGQVRPHRAACDVSCLLLAVDLPSCQRMLAPRYSPKAGFGKGRVRRLGHLLFSPTGDLTGDLFFFLNP